MVTSGAMGSASLPCVEAYRRAPTASLGLRQHHCRNRSIWLNQRLIEFHTAHVQDRSETSVARVHSFSGRLSCPRTAARTGISAEEV
jgi:hypothetical protein